MSNESQPLNLENSQAENAQPIDDKEYNSEGDEILPKDNLRSKWWENFQKIRVKGTGAVKARCLFCNKKLIGDGKNGTKHLQDHSKSCLKKKWLMASKRL